MHMSWVRNRSTGSYSQEIDSDEIESEEWGQMMTPGRQDADIAEWYCEGQLETLGMIEWIGHARI